MNELIKFVLEPNFQGWINVLRIFLMFLSLVLFIALVVFFNKATWWKRMMAEDMEEFLSFKRTGIKKIEKDWIKTKARLDSGLESEYKLALIEAETVLDDTLNRMGYLGDSLGEKLKKLTPIILPNISSIQDAHRIRNNIVHDPDYRLSLDEAKNSVNIYEEALRSLDAF